MANFEYRIDSIPLGSTSLTDWLISSFSQSQILNWSWLSSQLLATMRQHLDVIVVAPMALKMPELISIWLGNYNILCAPPAQFSQSHKFSPAFAGERQRDAKNAFTFYLFLWFVCFTSWICRNGLPDDNDNDENDERRLKYNIDISFANHFTF